MKIEPKFFAVTVNDGEASAFQVVVSYFIDHEKRFIGYEFYERVTSFAKDQRLCSRLLTFKEELRTFGQASGVYEGMRENDAAYIETQMHEAYGKNAIVTVNEINR